MVWAKTRFEGNVCNCLCSLTQIPTIYTDIILAFSFKLCNHSFNWNVLFFKRELFLSSLLIQICSFRYLSRRNRTRCYRHRSLLPYFLDQNHEHFIYLAIRRLYAYPEWFWSVVASKVLDFSKTFSPRYPSCYLQTRQRRTYFCQLIIYEA